MFWQFPNNSVNDEIYPQKNHDFLKKNPLQTSLILSQTFFCPSLVNFLIQKTVSLQKETIFSETN